MYFISDISVYIYIYPLPLAQGRCVCLSPPLVAPVSSLVFVCFILLSELFLLVLVGLFDPACAGLAPDFSFICGTLLLVVAVVVFVGSFPFMCLWLSCCVRVPLRGLHFHFFPCWGLARSALSVECEQNKKKNIYMCI